MSLIESLTSRIKSVQSKLVHYIDGRPTIQILVEETLKIEGEKTKSSTIEMDGDYEINSDGRLALKNPICPIHGNQYITKNGWTKNTLEIITGDKIKIVRQMHICTKCATIFMPSLECLKIPYGRITKDGQRFLLELTIEDGISLRKAKRRLKNTFGFEISVDRLWYLIQSTGKKCNEKTNEIVVNFSGIVCYDEDIIRKTDKNAAKMTLLDAVNTYAIKEEVRENKQSDTIKDFMVEGLKNKAVHVIVTDFDPKYSDIIENNFQGVLHQYCVGHFNDIIDDDLRKAAGLKYKKKKELPEDYIKLKGEIYYIFSSKNRMIAEKKLYRLFQDRFGKDKAVDELLLKTKSNFYNLTHFMDDRRIPKTNNILESRYSTTESNYNNNRRFKTVEGANNYCNCQTIFRNFHIIEEGTYVNSSPYSRAGMDHANDDWLNIMGLGDKIFNFIKTLENGVLSKLGIA